MDSAYFYLIIIVLTWTLNPFIKKQIVEKIDSENYIFINHTVMSIIILLYFIYRCCFTKVNVIENFNRFDKKDLFILILGSILTVIGSILLPYIISLKKDIGYIISNIQPLVITLTVLIGYLLFNEKINKDKIIGIFFVVIGLIFINRK